MYRPQASLLLRQPVPDWPATATNGELLELARVWRGIALACNADKLSIENGAATAATGIEERGQAPSLVTDEKPAPEAKPWWRFW